LTGHGPEGGNELAKPNERVTHTDGAAAAAKLPDKRARSRALPDLFPCSYVIHSVDSFKINQLQKCWYTDAGPKQLLEQFRLSFLPPISQMDLGQPCQGASFVPGFSRSPLCIKRRMYF
jgi:hypothetical protein